MKLEDQVCSLPLAKRLKELGVEQDGMHIWASLNGSSFYLYEGGDYDNTGAVTYSAFTVAELGEMLPVRFTSERRPDGRYCVVFWAVRLPVKYESTFGKTEADARAKMLIYLIENGLVKP